MRNSEDFLYGRFIEVFVRAVVERFVAVITYPDDPSALALARTPPGIGPLAAIRIAPGHAWLVGVKVCLAAQPTKRLGGKQNLQGSSLVREAIFNEPL